MQSKPAVSVIIPVHNGQTYLRECLDSVVSQTLADLELIIVDDASTDATADILADYAKEATRPIRVITQTHNRGVSAARNAGIDAARGRYVAFVDADDVVRRTMYESMLAIADGGALDMISCAIQLFDSEGTLGDIAPYPMAPGFTYTRPQVRELLETGFTSKMLWFPFRSLYLKSLLDIHAIRFDSSIRKGEDSVFNLEVLSNARRCASVLDAYYLYRKHTASVTARPLELASANFEALGNQVTRIVQHEGLPDSTLDDFYRYLLASDLPTALLRLSGVSHNTAEIRRLKSSYHTHMALSKMKHSNLPMPVRVRMLLLATRYSPASLLSGLLTMSRLLKNARSHGSWFFRTELSVRPGP